MAFHELNLVRLHADDDSTIGALYDDQGALLCFTLEDEPREVKVPGETRIPSGRYQLRLRTWGGFHERYSKKFPQFHKGMIELCGVPGFSDILMHLGNTDDDSAGCLLLGAQVTENRFRNGYLGMSEQGYSRVYPIIAELIEKGATYIMVHDSPFKIKT